MAHIRLLNMTHALLHPVQHLSGTEATGGNLGFASELVKMIKARQFRHIALRWCPVCTLAAIWLWLKDRHNAH